MNYIGHGAISGWLWYKSETTFEVHLITSVPIKLHQNGQLGGAKRYRRCVSMMDGIKNSLDSQTKRTQRFPDNKELLKIWNQIRLSLSFAFTITGRYPNERETLQSSFLQRRMCYDLFSMYVKCTERFSITWSEKMMEKFSFGSRWKQEMLESRVYHQQQVISNKLHFINLIIDNCASVLGDVVTISKQLSLRQLYLPKASQHYSWCGRSWDHINLPLNLPPLRPW